ncbi:MAG: ATPase [Bacteroidia bacterium]|nr:MAG: ATPase [Bacteroidia bacterium]
MLHFYNREKERALLERIAQKSLHTAQMTFVVGRRRVGKTALLLHTFSNSDTLYFFIEKKNEVLLCQEFVNEIRYKFDIPIFGEMRTFKEVFAFLMHLSQERPFTLIIDEFQEFQNLNASIYSEMQHIWDANKDKSKLNLILCGSVYTLMTKIFEDSKEPLFGRATAQLKLKSFDINTIKSIISDYEPHFTNEDLLAFYLFTGGVAKYVELLVAERAFSLEAIVEIVFSENSLFLDEGRNMLVSEFGKYYGNYFSILSLLASSKTSRSEIESILDINVGGFLDKLETEYSLIAKIRPIFAKPASRTVKYKINDNFLNFWFRFIYKYRSVVEIGNFEYLKTIFKRDYTMYSGKILEQYFIEKMITEENLSQIGTYWEKGNQNEIDIVAVNASEKFAILAEVKCQKERININTLKSKAQKLIEQHLKGYTIEYRALSIGEM